MARGQKVKALISYSETEGNVFVICVCCCRTDRVIWRIHLCFRLILKSYQPWLTSNRVILCYHYGEFCGSIDNLF